MVYCDELVCTKCDEKVCAECQAMEWSDQELAELYGSEHHYDDDDYDWTSDSTLTAAVKYWAKYDSDGAPICERDEEEGDDEAEVFVDTRGRKWARKLE